LTARLTRDPEAGTMSATPAEPTAAQVAARLGRSWGWVLVAGIASFLAGVVSVFWPGVTVLALVIVLGVFLLFAGATELGWAVAERHEKGWGVLLFRGIVDVIAGIVVLAWPGATALVLALLLAAWLLVYAAITLWYAYRHRGERPHTGHFLAKGIVAIVVAVITVAWPGITILVIALAIGIALIIQGVILMRLAFVLRRARTT
jgi:uncharacterized membrane protein HdeD (DUF308 family)